MTDIIVDPNRDEFPLLIMVKFDRYTGPTVDGSVPIAQVEGLWVSNGRDCTRLQFPLLLAFAITIDKSQGLTLEKAVVNINDKERSLRLAYVALSRVKTFEGLAFDVAHNFSRFSNIAKHRYLPMRRQEEERLIDIAL